MKGARAETNVDDGIYFLFVTTLPISIVGRVFVDPFCFQWQYILIENCLLAYELTGYGEFRKIMIAHLPLLLWASGSGIFHIIFPLFRFIFHVAEGVGKGLFALIFSAL